MTLPLLDDQRSSRETSRSSRWAKLGFYFTRRPSTWSSPVRLRWSGFERCERDSRVLLDLGSGELEQGGGVQLKMQSTARSNTRSDMGLIDRQLA